MRENWGDKRVLHLLLNTQWLLVINLIFLLEVLNIILDLLVTRVCKLVNLGIEQIRRYNEIVGLTGAMEIGDCLVGQIIGLAVEHVLDQSRRHAPWCRNLVLTEIDISQKWFPPQFKSIIYKNFTNG